MEKQTAQEQGKLTPEQIANWKRVFPEFGFYPDEMIQRLRDAMQSRADQEALNIPASDEGGN